MPFPSSLSVSDTSSSCVADLYSGQCTPRSDLCLCACSYGVKSFAGERLSRVPIKGCRKRSSPHPYSRPADSLSDSSAMQGFCRPHENLATARNGFSFDNSSESSCSGFVSSPSSGLNGHGKRANPLYGHGKESHHMQASCRQRGRVARFTCRSQSIDMGFSDTQTFQPAMWDQPCLPHLGDSFEDSIFLDSTISTPSDTYYIPLQPETIDPISQLACQHAMGKNMQWWRFLLYCRAQLGSPFSKRIKYSLVGKNYTRVLLPSRARAKVLVVPAFSIALKQEPLSMAVDHLTLVADEILGWFQQMGSRYGASLLCLLVLGYWIQGFRCFPWLAMSYHLKDGLQVDPAMLQFLQSTVNLPMVAKPVYGIISDAIYIGGARRMPYLMIAGVLQALSWSTIALHSGIRSSIAPLMGILLVSNVGAAIAEVVNDALVAEAVQKERGRAKGELQSFVWLALAIGGVLGNLTGGFALSRLSSTTMCAIFFTLVAGQFVVSALVKEKSFNFKVSRPFRSKKVEEKGKAVENVKQQAMKLMELVSRPEIARPLAWFAASYAVIPALAGSLFFYQTQNLKIHPTFLGLAKVMGQMGLLAGSLLYNRYLKKSSPRQILMALQILLSICMLSDVFLVTRLNITVGIPDQLYVLGASAFVEAIAQFKVLPFSVLLTQLCPAGSEGSLLAFFMSCHCLASILSGYTGTILASFLHLSADSFAGLPLGILIQSLAALIPLLWISCIPSCPNKQVVI